MYVSGGAFTRGGHHLGEPDRTPPPRASWTQLLEFQSTPGIFQAGFLGVHHALSPSQSQLNCDGVAVDKRVSCFRRVVSKKQLY